MAYSTNEMMTVAAARRLKNGSVCFVGIGLPSKAANLARLTSSPDVVLIYESGPIGAKPSVLPLSIGDGELAETADDRCNQRAERDFQARSKTPSQACRTLLLAPPPPDGPLV